MSIRPQEIQRERQAAEIQVEKEQEVSAVSEYINVGPQQLERLNEEEFASPIMKNAYKLPELEDIKQPTPEQIAAAREKVGIDVSSTAVKRNRRINRTDTKFKRLAQLSQKRKKLSKHKLTADENKELSFDNFYKMDLGSIMYEDAGDLGDEKLIAHYEVIKARQLRTAQYEADIKEQEERGDIPEEEIKFRKARLMALKDVNSYYQVMENLMANSYYLSLPRKTMMELSYNDLRSRLSKLYKKEPKDVELIDYYQNLIRLKQLDISDAKSVREREKKYLKELKGEEEKEDTRNPEKEMKKMVGGFYKLLSTLESEDDIHTKEEKLKYYKQMFSIYENDIEEFKDSLAEPTQKEQEFLRLFNEYKQTKDKEEEQEKSTSDIIGEVIDKDEKRLKKKGDGEDILSDEQKEGLKKIQGWLLRHSCDQSSKKNVFVFKLLESPPEQQLMAFYLIEKERAEASQSVDFYSALNGYVPDMAEFKSNVTNWRGKIQWDLVSMAVRKSVETSDQIAAYLEADKEIKQSEKKRKEPEDPNKTTLDKKTDLFAEVAKRGAMLRLLYRSAGLSEDMPPDMAEDEVLRKRLFKEYREIGSLLKQITAIGAEKNEKKNVDYSAGDKIEAQDFERHEDENVHEERFERLDLFNEIAGNVLEEDDLMVGIGKVAEAWTDNAVYGYSSYGIGAIVSILGFASACYSAHVLRNTEGITMADRVAQAFGVSSDMINGLFGGLSGATFMAEAVGWIQEAAEVAEEVAEEVVETTTSWLGDASESAWVNFSEAGVAAQIQVVAGAGLMVAGLVQTVSGAIKFQRAKSSAKDVKNARDAYDDIQAEKKKKKQAQTKDDKQFDRFLKNQDRDMKIQKASAAVGMVTGALNLFAGFTISSGLLSPLGGIAGLVSAGIELGYSRFVGKKMRHGKRKRGVDDFLDMDNMVKYVLENHPEKARLKKMKKDTLREKIREEALAELGFATYKDCYRHICIENAKLLYDKVFVHKPEDKKERDMYIDALKSLGLKVTIPEQDDDDTEPEPDINAMVEKMME